MGFQGSNHTVKSKMGHHTIWITFSWILDNLLFVSLDSVAWECKVFDTDGSSSFAALHHAGILGELP